MDYRNAAATAEFLKARDLLLNLRDDYEAAYAQFTWPQLETFNWALDWFDRIAVDNRQPALIVAGDNWPVTVSYAELSERSNRVANWLRRHGVRRGDRVLLMLDNQVATWEILLAAMKLGAVVLPTYLSASAADLADRMQRGRVRHVITTSARTDAFASVPAEVTRFCVGDETAGWLCYDDAYAEEAVFRPDAPTRGDELLFLYFTSGTTSRPKLVAHTHTSYPVGHLSGMYWNGLLPGDVHLNVSAPGWAKHAWSSFFGPFNAGATVLSVNTGGSPTALLDALVVHQVNSFCAPPTVWRLLIQQELARWPVTVREVCSVGEPLNAEVIEQVRQAWGRTVRDGYGQSETTAQIGNPPGFPLRPGAMGVPLPGYDIALVDPQTGRPDSEGEICVDLSRRPVGVMTGYLDDPEKNAATFANGYYHTGDIAFRDADGYLTYIGRNDDVFKSYDHRISPFELESLLIEHDAVAEAAIVPSPDPVGLVVPKAYVTLRAGMQPSAETARSILSYARENLAPHQWIRMVEFAALPKTTSGKIRRAELRSQEQRRGEEEPVPLPRSEYRAEDLFADDQSVPTAPGL